MLGMRTLIESLYATADAETQLMNAQRTTVQRHSDDFP